MKLAQKYKRVAEEFRCALRVDNEVDAKRLFTCPLSLHRELNRVCVFISLNDLDRFTPEWTHVGFYRHYEGWNRWETGEADMLAEKACRSVAFRPLTPSLRSRRTTLDEQINRWLSLR
jgi:hypothetical protein